MTAPRALLRGWSAFRKLFAAVPVPAYSWRRRGDEFVLESFNRAAELASERRAASYVGRTAAEVYADEPEILADFERAGSAKEAFTRELWYTAPDTERRHALEVTYAPVAKDLLVVHTVSRTEERRIRAELEERLDDLRAADAARRRLLDDLLRAQERERERIAEEIQEDAIETLVTVALRLQTAQRTGDPQVAELVSKLEASVTDAIARLRHLTFALHPESLARTTLAAAIRDLLEHATARTATRSSIENRLTREPDEATRVRAYRIAQQAIANAVRHAGATVITVLLYERDDELVVVVGDDGQGFDAGSVTAVPDGGIALMRRRAQLSGGSVEVQSAPGRGTTVRTTLPAKW